MVVMKTKHYLVCRLLDERRSLVRVISVHRERDRHVAAEFAEKCNKQIRETVEDASDSVFVGPWFGSARPLRGEVLQMASGSFFPTYFSKRQLTPQEHKEEFLGKRVVQIHTHMAGHGDGVWYRLADGTVVDRSGDPSYPDPGLYDQL